MELLNRNVIDCTSEMAGIGMSTIATSNENDANITEASTDDDDDREIQIEITGQQNRMSVTS